VQIAAGVIFLALVVIAVLIDIALKRFHVANIKYYSLFGFALFLGIGMIADVYTQSYAFGGTAIILAFASVLLFLMGFEVSNQLPAKITKQRTFCITHNQLFGLSIIFFLLGFFFLALEWMLYGQIISYSGTLVSETKGVTPMPFVHMFTQLAAPASLLAFIQLRRGANFIQKCVLGACLAATVIWYFLWGARGNFVWLAVVFLVVWAEVPNRRGIRRLGLKPFVACLLTLVPVLILGSIRGGMTEEAARDIHAANTVEETWKSLDTYTQFRRTLEFFPGRADYLWGYSFYGIVANPIPRVFWEDKPVGVGRLASILYDDNPNNSIGLSLPGELYANFGMVGSLICMFLLGVLSCSIYRWYMRQRSDPGVLVIYTLLLTYVGGELRGDMLDATLPIFYYVLPVAGSLALATAMNRTRLRNMKLAALTAGARAGAGRLSSLAPDYRTPESATD
jgi:oligosaccharide repeat unit polymerase